MSTDDITLQKYRWGCETCGRSGRVEAPPGEWADYIRLHHMLQMDERKTQLFTDVSMDNPDANGFVRVRHGL